MRVKTSVVLSDPEKRLSPEELTLYKALKILPKPEESYIILELNDEHLDDISPYLKKIMEELNKQFLARFGTCLWIANLLSLTGKATGGKTTKAYRLLKETLEDLRQKLLSIANEEMGRRSFDF